MNHYAPKEICDHAGLPTGKWHYCCTNSRGGTFAVGPCGLLKNCPRCAGSIPTNPFGPMVLAEGEVPDPEHCPACNGTGVVNTPEAERCPGHDTPEGACEHFRSHLIATARLFPETPARLRQATRASRCAVPKCTKLTVGYATWGSEAGGVAPLCDKHCTRHNLQHVIKVGESWVS